MQNFTQDSMHIVQECMHHYYESLAPSLAHYELLVAGAKVTRTTCAHVRIVLKSAKWSRWYTNILVELKVMALGGVCHRVRAIMKSRIRHDTVTVRGIPLLTEVCRRGMVPMATVFIEEGGFFGSMARGKKLDLVVASVKNNKLKMAQFLVDTCAIGVQQPSGPESTAILVAVKYAHIEMIAFLLGHSGDINQLYSGETLLHTAARYNYIAVVELLVTRGADPGTRNALGENVAELAVRYDYVGVMRLLIEKGGVDVSACTTFLHNAVKHDYVHMTKLLIEKGGVDVSAGTTFLHNAVKHNYVHMTKLLLDKGADADAPDALGVTPREIALRYNYRAILALL